MKSLFCCCTALAAISAAAILSERSLSCREMLIPVSIKANNKQLPLSLTAADITTTYLDSVAALPDTPVSGDFSIAARYCNPTVKNVHRQNTLQILVHGATYTVDYWSGLAAPGTKQGQDRYSWISYAAGQGYPTLSVDRLCNGDSSRPNGITVCQMPLEAAAIHAIVKKARAGMIPGVKTKFTKIINIGHSLGSVVLNRFSQTYPQDADALLLTGFSVQVTQAEAGIFSNAKFLPASVVAPDRFGSDDPSYLISTSQAGITSVFYYGAFNPAISAYDYANRHTVTIGEAATAQLGQLPATEYRGALFVLNGNNDAAFCNENAGVSAQPSNCTDGFSTNVQRFYPSASTFGFHNTANTGHCLNDHLTAQRSFQMAHNFLKNNGF